MTTRSGSRRPLHRHPQSLKSPLQSPVVLPLMSADIERGEQARHRLDVVRRKHRLKPDRLAGDDGRRPSSYPGFAFNPAASMPAIAQISSLSEVSPLTPTAPSRTPPSWISTPPGTGISRPCAIVFTALMK